MLAVIINTRMLKTLDTFQVPFTVVRGFEAIGDLVEVQIEDERTCLRALKNGHEMIQSIENTITNRRA